MSCNLSSVGRINEFGGKTTFSDTVCEVHSDDNVLLAVGNKVGTLYYLNCTSPTISEANVSESIENKVKLWHQRFCHLGYDNLRKLLNKNMVSGIDCSSSLEKPFCSDCCNGKNHKQPFPTFESEKRVVKPLELIHSDICGKITPDSLGGARYFLTFIDEATKFT